MKTPRPNVLIIMCDQLTARVLGCYGGQVPTPNIDRLAEQGVLFTDAVCSTPFCSPSRASIITGLYPHNHGIVTNVNRRDYPAIGGPPTEDGIKAGDVTTERLLHEAGYDTHHYGKWHLMDEDLPYYPDMFGEHHEYADAMQGIFDLVRRQKHESWMNWYDWALPVEVDARFREALVALGDRWQDNKYAEFLVKMGRLRLPAEDVFDVHVANRTVEALTRSRSSPFMITCSLNYPHDPNVVPSPYYETFKPEDIELPENVKNLEDRFKRDWSRQIVSDLGEAGMREFLRIYYGCVKLVDDQVGRVLDALDAAGQASNTIVLFTADHGDMAGGHGMVWKSTQCFYDDVACVPLIIRYPGKIRPRRTSMSASVVDLMPTLLELAGLNVPKGLDGHSLAPYLTGRRSERKAPPVRFCERLAPDPGHTRTPAPGRQGSFMLRGQGLKYCRFADGEEFLYDLESDPGETANLVPEPDWAKCLKGLRRELDNWLVESGLAGT